MHRLSNPLPPPFGRCPASTNGGGPRMRTGVTRVPGVSDEDTLLTAATRRGPAIATGWKRRKGGTPMSLVHGTVAPGYEKVREVFAAEAARLGDVSAQLAAYRHGRPV